MENILLILFALFLGYMLNRLNIMQRDGSIALNKFVLYVSYPAIVLLQTPKISFSLELMIPAIVAWVVMTLSAFLILFLSKIFDFSKEVTGSLDEVQVITIKNEIERLRQLEQRRESILKSIEGQGKLTQELSDKITAAETLSTLEDLYLPYKPKRRTKATVAREKGLEPLAHLILAQQTKELFPEALQYVNKELGVEHPDDA